MRIDSQNRNLGEVDSEQFVQVPMEIELTQLDSERIAQNSSIWCLNSRNKRNFARVTLASSLTTAGSWLTGFVPNIWGLIGGGILSGVGNGASTWLDWETKTQSLIRARSIDDFSKVKSKVHSIEKRVSCLMQHFQMISPNEVTELAKQEEESEDESRKNCLCPIRNRRNFIRVFVAGALSGAGGALSGFNTTLVGILVGGILAGIGNGVSTWVTFENPNDSSIKKRMLNELPNLVQLIQENEEKLFQLMVKVNSVSQVSSFNNEIAQDRSFVENEADESSFWAIRTRCRRNFIYVNTAGWISATGDWLRGFFPNIQGILIGSALGAVANSMSAWLRWEKKDDRHIEQVAVREFPVLASKIARLSRQITFLQTTVPVERIEKSG